MPKKGLESSAALFKDTTSDVRDGGRRRYVPCIRRHRGVEKPGEEYSKCVLKF